MKIESINTYISVFNERIKKTVIKNFLDEKTRQKVQKTEIFFELYNGEGRVQKTKNQKTIIDVYC